MFCAAVMAQSEVPLPRAWRLFHGQAAEKLHSEEHFASTLLLTSMQMSAAVLRGSALRVSEPNGSAGVAAELTALAFYGFIWHL